MDDGEEVDNDDVVDDIDDDDRRCGNGRGLYPRLVGEDNVCNESLIESELYLHGAVDFRDVLDGELSVRRKSNANR